MWLALGILRVIAMLPFRWQLRAGRMLGRLLWLLPFKNKQYARINLKLCFPELGDTERKRLLRDNIINLGVSLVEMAAAWWATDATLSGLARVDGLEHLRAAVKQGKGVLLLSAHFTNLELGGRLLRTHIDFAVLYRHMKNPLADIIMKRGRQRHYHAVIHRNDIRAMLRSLKQGLPVWYAPDQNYAGDHRVFVNFFNIPASSNSATSRVAKLSGAPVVPFFQHRLPDDQGYQLTILPAMDDFPSGDAVADTQRISDVIEQQVRKVPEQYLWVQRRFRDRPDNAPYLYTDRKQASTS